MRSHAKVLVAVASLFALLALAPIASAAPKTVIAEIGGDLSSGNNTAGGLFNLSRGGVALNQSGAGGVPKGTFYVLDWGNARIQQFNPGGQFVRAWGAGVLSGEEAFEVCGTAASCRAGRGSSIAGGLSGRTNGEDAPGIAVDQGTGSIYVSDSANQRIDVYGATGTFQGAFGYGVKAGAPAEELQFCTTLSGCKAGTEGGKGGQAGGPLGDIALAPAGSPNAGDLFLANRVNLRVEEYKPKVEGGIVTGASFVRAFGKDVVTGGVTTFEVCSIAAECKKGASTTTETGGFGSNLSFSSPSDVAVDSDGNVFALDANNKRIQEFSSTAAPITATFGSAAIASTFGTAANLLQNIAADPSSTPSHLFASGQREAAAKAVAVLELDNSGAAIATHGTELTATESLGLAIAPPSLGGYVFLPARQAGGIGGSLTNRVLVLGDQATPAIEAATALTPTSAVLHGQVVSNNVETSYRFERSSDGGKTWVKVPGSEVVVPPTAGNVAVEQTASGLTPNTDYLFRLVSTRPKGGFPFTSDTEGFTTLTAPPAVPASSAVDVQDTSARLVAEIDPNGSPTTYVFKYGTTPSFGSATTPASVGSGNEAVVVSQAIGGLAPDTTYFFQAVASNPAGEGPGPVESFTTRATPLPLPDDRAYEMVSPPEKNFGPADGGASRAISAQNGEAAAFCTSSQFGEEAPMTTKSCADYISQRSAGGWKTKGSYPHYCSLNPQDAGVRPSFAEPTGFSPNLDFAVFKLPESPGVCSIPPLDPAALLGTNLYRENLLGEPTVYDLLAPNAAAPPALNTLNAAYGAASDDFGHIVYTSTAIQAEGASGTFEKVYQWDHGTLRLVSVKPDGTPFTTASTIPHSDEQGKSDGVNVVSSDGSRIFFQNQIGLLGCTTATCRLYVREDGTKTVEVSQTECTSACGAAAAANLEWATPDGQKALFISAEKLSDEDPTSAGADLYLFTDGPDPTAEKNLTLLSKDNEPADGSSAEVLGMIGMSEDGDTVYFAAKGQILAGQPTAVGPKVYRWRRNGGSPTLDYLATLVFPPLGSANLNDEQNWNAKELSSGLTQPVADLVSPDGAELVVETVKPLEASADHDSDLDVYRWSEVAGWDCLSCQALGIPSHGISSYDQLRFRDGSVIKRTGKELRTVMSDDGQRIFFTTSDPLAPGDTNEARDVYEWHDGRVELISDGAGRGGTLLGVSRDGRDVFFYTAQRLVGWDTDEFVDIYDARIGGGFPEPPADVPPCEDDACQGAQAQAPAAAQPGTLAPGAGDFSEAAKKPRCRRAKAHRKKAKAHKSAKPHHKKKARPCRRRSKS